MLCVYVDPDVGIEGAAAERLQLCADSGLK
jgi:hypothetical protein